MFVPSSFNENVNNTFCEYSVRVNYDVSRCMTQEEFSAYTESIGYSSVGNVSFVVILVTLLLIGLIFWIMNKK